MTEPDSDAAPPVELWGPPAFELGDKVAAVREVRNDGTFPGARIGDVLIRAGEVGYVHSVGTYLNRYYIYGIDFIESARLVGMRAAELTLLEKAPDAPPS
jgi:nitrogen fixation protein NifZ